MEVSNSRDLAPVSGRLPWLKTLAVLAPLWMFALAAAAEGFPDPPIPGNLARVLFYAGLAVAILVTFLFHTLIELPFIILIPALYIFEFDEITTTYKTPFILFCTLILSLGIIAFHYLVEKRSLKVALPILLGVAILALLAGMLASKNFWGYTDSLGIERCFLDYTGCPALPADHPAWWRFFIGV